MKSEEPGSKPVAGGGHGREAPTHRFHSFKIFSLFKVIIEDG
jgi:hypothetical protein